MMNQLKVTMDGESEPTNRSVTYMNFEDPTIVTEILKRRLMVRSSKKSA